MIDERAESDAKDKLKKFIQDTYKFLNDRVQERNKWFPEDLGEYIGAAWKEFSEDFKLSDAEGAIDSANPERLQWAGLYGAQLDLKLRVVQRWKARFLGRRIKKFLGRVLDAIERILDSLIAAIGLGEALKELKDILSDSLDDEED